MEHRADQLHQEAREESHRLVEEKVVAAEAKIAEKMEEKKKEMEEKEMEGEVEVHRQRDLDLLLPCARRVRWRRAKLLCAHLQQ